MSEINLENKQLITDSEIITALENILKVYKVLSEQIEKEKEKILPLIQKINVRNFIKNNQPLKIISGTQNEEK